MANVRRDYHKKYYARLKEKVLLYYGSECNCCREKNKEFLSIDHINGGGAQHRKLIKHCNFNRWLVKNNFPKGYRILCMNCNFSLGIYGYCPHEYGKSRSII